jgi:TetR/AcrR family transcriptional repressor of nem operon
LLHGPVGHILSVVTTRRTRILDAAARLIQQQGYERTSVDDIVRESGLSGKSHFYHYFTSKEALAHQVLEQQFERFAERALATLHTPTRAPLDRLGLFIDTLVALHRREGAAGASAFGGFASELAESHEGIRTRLDTVFARWESELGALFSDMRPDAGDGADPAQLARFIIAALEGGMLMARVKRDAGVMSGIGDELKQFAAARLRETTAS